MNQGGSVHGAANEIVVNWCARAEERARDQ